MQSPDTYHGHFAFFALAACLNESDGLWCVPKSCLTIHKTLFSLYRLNALWTAPGWWMFLSQSREFRDSKGSHTAEQSKLIIDLDELFRQRWFAYNRRFINLFTTRVSTLRDNFFLSLARSPQPQIIVSTFAHIQKSSRRASAVIALHVHSDTKNSLKQQSRAEQSVKNYATNKLYDANVLNVQPT